MPKPKTRLAAAASHRREQAQAPGVDQDFEAQVVELVTSESARLEEMLRQALDDIERLKAREREREAERERKRLERAEVCRRARVAKAAKRANKSADAWVRYCQRRGLDPEQIPDRLLARPRD